MGAEPVAVFKPSDEEPYTASNPKGHDQASAQARIAATPGEGALRETAAFLLDHNGAAAVPPTTIVVDSATGKKGSLQLFMPNDGAAEDFGASMFSVSDVHKIGMLDLRLLNSDRHGANLLVVPGETKGTKRLVPIDHGCSLPRLSSLLESDEAVLTATQDWNVVWADWKQSQTPFDESTLAQIASLDAEADIAKLRSHLPAIDEEAVLSLRIGTELLKRAAGLGYTLAEIGRLLRPKSFRDPSPFLTFLRRLSMEQGAENLFSAYLSQLSTFLAEHRSAKN